VLKAEELGLVLISREYYNSLRKLVPDKAKPETIDALLMELHEAGFVYRTRVQEDVDDEDNVVKRKMIQLWFTHREQLNIAARFCADFLIVVDGTFNTNKDRLPLLIAVGVLNSGKTFPVCFSYYPSESEDSFKFIWDSLNEECFVPDGNLPAPPPPRVILNDQAGGIIASVPKAFPGCQVQSCD
jgi:hypothetical protein